MRHLSSLLVAVAFLSEARAQDVKRDIPYADPALERQVLDVYSPAGAQGPPLGFLVPRRGGREGPARGLLDPRRRLADGRQVERPAQAAGLRGERIRLRLDELPAPAER